MPKGYREIAVSLFLSLLIGCGAFSNFLFPSPGIFDLDEEFERARKFYLNGDYLDSLLILAALEKQAQIDETLDNKSEFLADIHFLSGLCFLEGWNQTDRGKDSFTKALKYNPSFQVKEELYGQKATQLFLDLTKTEPEKSPHPLASEPSQEYKSVRIINKDAVLRLKPSNEGTILKKLPLGALLEVAEDWDDWLKIKLPPDKTGFIVIGYVRKSFTESFSTIH
jgi:hypothetical protein